jgi:hypothetical protein
MMAKMFYTMDEAKDALGKSEDEIRQLAKEGRLREFRDGPRLMFKADQVEQLRSELGMGGGAVHADQVDLGMSDSGGLIGLVDTTGASGTSITLSDADTGGSGSGSGSGLRMKDDTALAADLGLSGTLGGMPSPGPRSGAGTPSGTGLSGSMSGRSGVGINVFGTDDSAEHVDPMAQTAITGGIRDQIDLQAVGSGSGLLDLTRESDDTSLGAVLDEITPTGAPPSVRRGGYEMGSPEGSFGAGQFEDVPASPRVSGPPVYIEREDPLAPAFGGAALGAAVVCMFAIFILVCSIRGTRPAVLDHNLLKGATVMSGVLYGMAIVVILFIGGFILGRVVKR